jgi:ferritin-like metal-binding protein YciE
MDTVANLGSTSQHALSPEKLKQFFISHLNRIYCAKSHLQEWLPEMRVYAHFNDLINAISETLVDVEKQISRMEEIYILLDIKPSFENCEGVIGLIEDTFSVIQQGTNDLQSRDLSILFYLQNIESIEMTSFKMLRLAAPQLDKKEIKQLLKENFDEASEDLALLNVITSSYFRLARKR